jgi:glycosyltransferase involved in cell wall biosynthesis
MKRIRILFQRSAESTNTNSQSTTVREIVLRLDPDRFECALWYEREPDSRLCQRPNIHLLRLPARRKTGRIFREMLSGYDIVAYVDVSPASYAFVHLPRGIRKMTVSMLQVEAPAAQLVNPSLSQRILHSGIAANCDVYTAVTEYIAHDMELNMGRKAKYILPLGVDCRVFVPPSERTNATPTVLFVGTVIERKGVQYLLDAAARFPAAKFRLIGGGRDGYDLALYQKADAMGLRNVVFEGARSQEFIAQALRQSDIFVLPSRLEGLPKVTLEAAATGLPAVVFNDYQTPSVVDGVSGFQVTSIDEMVERLGKLISDSGLRQTMGAAARKHAETFDWDVVTRHWDNAYFRISEER